MGGGTVVVWHVWPVSVDYRPAVHQLLLLLLTVYGTGEVSLEECLGLD